MVTFKHKNGGICKVYSEANIKRLRKDKNYTELPQEEKPSQQLIKKESK